MVSGEEFHSKKLLKIHVTGSYDDLSVSVAELYRHIGHTPLVLRCARGLWFDHPRDR